MSAETKALIAGVVALFILTFAVYFLLKYLKERKPKQKVHVIALQE